MHFVIYSELQIQKLVQFLWIRIKEPTKFIDVFFSSVTLPQQVVLQIDIDVDFLNRLKSKNAELVNINGHVLLDFGLFRLVLDAIQLVLGLLENEVLPIIWGTDGLSKLLRNLFVVHSILKDSVRVVQVVLVLRKVHAHDWVLTVGVNFILV